MADVVVEASDTGTGYNDFIAFISPSINFKSLGIRPSSHVMEILAPSSNSGTYEIEVLDDHHAKVNYANEPLNETMFTYRLLNVNFATNVAIITGYRYNVLYDPNIDFVGLGVQGEWDEEHVPDYTGIWKISVSGTPYDVYSVLPDGGVVLSDPSGTLPSASATISYVLKDPSNDTRASSVTGSLTVKNRGEIDLNDVNIESLDQYAVVGDYVKYSGTEYKIISTDNNKIQIEGYSGGNAGGISIEIRRLLVNSAIGYFDYAGLKLDTTINHETTLGILNGDNAPIDPNDITDNSLMKENFLVKIGNDYYKISQIDGTTITLSGLPKDWQTLSAGGTTVNYEIHHFIKDTVEAQFMVFDELDRGGKDVVVREIESSVTNDVAVVALQMPSGVQCEDIMRTEESISFEIAWKNGKKIQGELE
jgi:hypothetical protein